jgi:uncharacterized protein YjbI with pentapeptide repeats
MQTIYSIVKEFVPLDRYRIEEIIQYGSGLLEERTAQHKQKFHKLLLDHTSICDDVIGIITSYITTVAVLLNDETWYSYNLSYSDLSGIDLSGIDLSDSLFNECNLSGSNLSNCRTSGSSFDGANFSDANLSYSNFEHSFLGKTNLTRANLTNVELSYSIVWASNITDAIIININTVGVRAFNQGLIDEYVASTDPEYVKMTDELWSEYL